MAKVLLTFKTNYAKSTLFPTGILARWNFAFIDEIYEQFIPSILITSSLVLFGDKVTKILCNSLFMFHFVLPILPCKWKTLYRKSHNLTWWKTKNEVTKICDELGIYENSLENFGFWSELVSTKDLMPNWF